MQSRVIIGGELYRQSKSNNIFSKQNDEALGDVPQTDYAAAKIDIEDAFIQFLENFIEENGHRDSLKHFIDQNRDWCSQLSVLFKVFRKRGTDFETVPLAGCTQCTIVYR